MHMNLDHMAGGRLVLGRDIHCEFDYWPLAVLKYARKAKDKLHKASERVSEICVQTLHRQEQDRMHVASMRESGDSGQF